MVEGQSWSLGLSKGRGPGKPAYALAWDPEAPHPGNKGMGSKGPSPRRLEHLSWQLTSKTEKYTYVDIP